jgi:hypothetical protein
MWEVPRVVKPTRLPGTLTWATNLIRIKFFCQAQVMWAFN